MLLKFIILVNIVSYATCRTSKIYREIPETAARLTHAEYPSYHFVGHDGPGSYLFGYEINDPATGNVQFRDEERLGNGTVKGSYGVLLPDNTVHITRYIADQFGYRASTETRKRSSNAPLKIEMQLQPTVAASTQAQDFPFVQSTPTPIVPPFETLQPPIDPIVASQILQQHQINLIPNYHFLKDRNTFDPYVANAFLNQMYYGPQNPMNGLRQTSYDNPVSTYSAPQNSIFPFFNWFGNNNNNQYQDQATQQPSRPVIDFFNNLAANNPIANFINGFNQPQNDNQNNNNLNPFQQFLNNINPLNFFNNFNNNNKPIQSLPITQSDYIQQNAPQPGTFMPTNNIDSSVFGNDHFLNPNTYYPNSQNNPPVIHNYYPTSSSFNDYYRPQYQPYSSSYPFLNLINNNNKRPMTYSQINRYPNTNTNPYNYYNPYQSMMSTNINHQNNKKTSIKKRKKNKNKVNVETDSDWFQDFLDKRKEANLDVSTKQSTKKSDDDYGLDLDDYFR